MEKNMPRNTNSNSRSYKKILLFGLVVAGIITLCYFWNLRSTNSDLRNRVNSEMFRRAEEAKRVEAMSGHLRSCEEEAERGKKMIQEKETVYQGVLAEKTKIDKSVEDLNLNIETARRELNDANKRAEHEGEINANELKSAKDQLSLCTEEKTKLSVPKSCDKESQASVLAEKHKIAAVIQKILGDESLNKLIDHGAFEGGALPDVVPNKTSPPNAVARRTDGLGTEHLPGAHAADAVHGLGQHLTGAAINPAVKEQTIHDALGDAAKHETAQAAQTGEAKLTVEKKEGEAHVANQGEAPGDEAQHDIDAMEKEIEAAGHKEPDKPFDDEKGEAPGGHDDKAKEAEKIPIPAKDPQY